jgi:hypothetical protein
MDAPMKEQVSMSGCQRPRRARRGLLALVAGLAWAVMPSAPRAQSTGTAPPKKANPAAPARVRNLPGPGAGAQDRPPAEVAEARGHFRRGVILYEDHDYNGALAEFETAHKLSREPVALYNVGLTLRALFRYVDAIDALSRYLNNTAMDEHVTARKRAEIEANISEMRALLAEVTIALPPGAKEAVMSIDGRQVPSPPGAPVLLSAGHHVVEVSAPDYERARKELDVTAGQNQRVDLAMKEITKNGTANIATSVAGSQIKIDGRPVGVAPVKATLGIGGHQLEASAPGYLVHRSELVIAAGQDRQVYVSMEIPPPPPGGLYRKWWFWTAVGAAAVGGTAAIVASQSSGGISKVNGSLGSSKVP